MPRLEIRMHRSRYEQLNPAARNELEQGLLVLAALNLNLDHNDISVEWIILERALNIADITLDVCYSTGEYEAPNIRELMPQTLDALRSYLKSFVQLLDSFHTTAVWLIPRPDARYWEDTKQ